MFRHVHGTKCIRENISGTVNSLKDIEMSQGHWNVSGTMEHLRDIGMSQGHVTPER